MIVGEIAQWRHHLSGEPWTIAFDYLQCLGGASPDGDTRLLDERIVGRVMSYDTRTPEEGLLEAHRRYVDVQTALDGAEGIEWFPQTALDVSVPYDGALDRELYRRPGAPPVRIEVYPGTFCVFFPEDAHLAQQIIGGTPRRIKKAVVKIALDLIR